MLAKPHIIFRNNENAVIADKNNNCGNQGQQRESKIENNDILQADVRQITGNQRNNKVSQSTHHHIYTGDFGFAFWEKL